MKTVMNTVLLSLFVLPLGSLSAQISIIERDFGQTTGNVVVQRTGARPPELQGIQLLPLECVGRTRLGELMPGATQLEAIPGAARLVLPDEKGSLYKYRRAAGASAAYGYFRVGPAGEARRVFELPGTGPTGADDPLPGRLAIATSGTHALVATSLAAGGNLIELDLLQGTAIDRTPDVAAQSFQTNGLALLGSFGVGVSDQAVYRFRRVAGGRAREVRIPRAVAHLGADVVTSADQSTVGFVAGDTINRAFVFTCRELGDAVQASDAPMRIPGAGFLPEFPSGPTLALSTDGSWVAWRREGSSSELYACETRIGGASDRHVTGSSHFDNTLNDTGVIAFFDPDSLVMVSGRHETDGVSRGDFYRIDLAASGIAAANLTRTSGIVAPPYDYGSLDTADGLFQLPGPQAGFLALDGGGSGRLLRVGVDGAIEVVLARVDSLDALELAGDHVVAQVTRPPGVDDPLEDSLNLVHLSIAAPGPQVLPLPIGCRISRESSRPDVYGGVLELEAGGEWLGRVSVGTLGGAALGTTPRNYGPTTTIGIDGTLYASMLASSRQLILAWSDLGVHTLRSCPRGSFILPGL
jgi:hypothetical protein